MIESTKTKLIMKKILEYFFNSHKHLLEGRLLQIDTPGRLKKRLLKETVIQKIQLHRQGETRYKCTKKGNQ